MSESTIMGESMVSETSLRIACVQMNSTDDKAQNLEAVTQFIVEAASNGAQAIFFPEVFNVRFTKSGAAGDAAECIDGPTIQLLQTLAKEHVVAILAGSIIETGEDGVFNTSVFISDTGDVLGVYRKIHLFDAQLEDVSISESATFAKGTDPVLVTWKGFKFGLSICFDLRFPELFRHYFLDAVDVITVPSSFTQFTGKAHWEVLCRARAIENQAYVIAPNQTGIGASEAPSYGNSMVVSPWGEVLARADDDNVSIEYATIDKQGLEACRKQIPCRGQVGLI